MSRKVRIERALKARQGRQPTPPGAPGAGGRSQVGRRVPRSGFRAAELWSGVVALVVGLIFALNGSVAGVLVVFAAFGLWAIAVVVHLLWCAFGGRDEVFMRVNDDGGSDGS